MKDRFGREIDYMRISVTDRCNLRCVYCMPAEGIETVPSEEILSYEEICRVGRIAAGLGIRKIKLTGGEPLVRKGLPDLVGMLHEIPDLAEITLTTNGVLLAGCIGELISSGLTAVNISLDTLDRQEFRTITRSDCFDRVMNGIHAACESGIRTKLNVVLRRECSWKKMAELARNLPLDVRFIELMPIGEGKEENGMSALQLVDEMAAQWPEIEKDSRIHGNGPAEYYRVPGFRGAIGVIHAIHGKFCGNCNRIRLTATGQIKPCLCYDTAYDLRTALRNGTDSEAEKIIKTAILAKPGAHCFEQPDKISEKRKMAAIGG